MFIKNFVKKGGIIASILQLDSRLSGQLFMYIKKNRGPSTDPWGTPDLTSSYEGVCPFSTTLW